jgi:hypothetical protein
VETAKKRKDLLQAGQLLEILMEDDPDSVAQAYQDLKGRGQKWNSLFEGGLASLDNTGVRESALTFFGLE